MGYISMINGQMIDIGCGFFFTPCRIILSFRKNEERNLLQTLLEKEKMAVTSIFTFVHNIFQGFFDRVILSRDNVVKCELFTTQSLILKTQKRLLKIWEKEKILATSISEEMIKI